MNNADSQVDVDEMRRKADEIELQALRCDTCPRRSRLSPKLYAHARRLRSEAQIIESRIRAYEQQKSNNLH